LPSVHFAVAFALRKSALTLTAPIFSARFATEASALLLLPPAMTAA